MTTALLSYTTSGDTTFESYFVCVPGTNVPDCLRVQLFLVHTEEAPSLITFGILRRLKPADLR